MLQQQQKKIIALSKEDRGTMANNSNNNYRHIKIINDHIDLKLLIIIL